METPLTILQVFVRRNTCQLRCKHCSARAGTAGNSNIVPLDRAKEIFAEVAAWREVRRGQIAQLFLQWLDDELAGDQDVELHEYVAALPGTPIRAVSTNGLWLSSLSDDEARGKIEVLKRVGKTEVQLSFHGLERTHDAFAGREGAFDALVRSLRLARRSGLTARCQVFVNQQNVGEMEVLYDFLHQSEGVGEKGICFPATNYMGRAKHHESIRLETSGRRQLPARIVAQLPECATEAETADRATGNPDAFWSSVLRVINPMDRVLIEITGEGNVLFGPTCSEVPENLTCVGNLTVASLSEIVAVIRKLKSEKAGSMPDIRELATRWVDRTNARLYQTHDCVLLWLERMRESKRLAGD